MPASGSAVGWPVVADSDEAARVPQHCDRPGNAPEDFFYTVVDCFSIAIPKRYVVEFDPCQRVRCFVVIMIFLRFSSIPDTRALTMLQSCANPQCTVFVVDDDDGAREALGCLLEAEGFAVRTYSSANGVLGEPTVPNNTCLVTDYHMPGMNGLELVDELRLRGNSMPAILITADPSQHVRDRAAAARVPVLEKLNLQSSVVECINNVVKAQETKGQRPKRERETRAH